MKIQNIIETKKEIPIEKNMYIVEHNLTKNHPLHRHEYYEFEFVKSGKGTVMINSTPYPFSAGTAWFCTSTDFHEIFIEEPAKIVNICFRIDWVENEILNSLPFGAVIQNYDEKIIDRFCKEYSSDEYGNRIYLKHSLSCVLIDFARVIEEKEKRDVYSKFSQPIGQALRFIHNHSNDDISLNDVAANVGLSPSYFSSRFHSELNISFQSYIINLRLETAAKFLISTNYSVTDICFISGFNNYVNFTKAFKKRYNMTPMQYRKNKHLKLSI